MKKKLSTKDIHILRNAMLETEKNLLKRFKEKKISLSVFRIEQKYLEEIRSFLNREESKKKKEVK
jgi:ribosome biogenesis protein Tsr3